MLLVDSSADLYVLSESLDGIRKYDGTGTELGSPRDPTAGGLAPSVALGPGDGLLIADPTLGHLLGYGPSGSQLLSLSLQSASNARGGIAYSEVANSAYVLHRKPTYVAETHDPAPGPGDPRRLPVSKRNPAHERKALRKHQPRGP